jgi:hypothetical protein
VHAGRLDVGTTPFLLDVENETSPRVVQPTILEQCLPRVENCPCLSLICIFHQTDCLIGKQGHIGHSSQLLPTRRNRLPYPVFCDINVTLVK